MSGRGVAALQTSQKAEKSGAPFSAGAAVNGLSVETAATGRIVLGQNIGEAGNPAILLSNREIPLGNSLVQFLNDSGPSPLATIGVTSDALDNPGLFFEDPNLGFFYRFQISRLSNAFELTSSGIAKITVFDSGVEAVKIDGGTFVNGALRNKRFVSNQVANYVIAFPDDTNKLFTNLGAGADINFDVSAALLGGEIFTVSVVDSFLCNIQGVGQTFRIDGLVTAAGGTVTSNAPGATITFELIDLASLSWVATSIVGTWTI